MKKNTVLQLIVIYVGLNAIYYCLTNAIQYAVFFLYPVTGSNTGYLLKYIAAFLLIGLGGVFVTFRSGGISSYIADRSGLDDSLTVYSKPQQLLSILIVVVALSQVVTRVPFLANGILSFFVLDDAGRTTSGGDGSVAFNFFAILFPCLMIVFCRPITVYFSKNILLDEEDMIVHQDTVDIETTGET